MGILEGETIVLFYGRLKTACVIFAIGNLELKKFLLKKASFVRAYISSYLQDKTIALCHKKMCEILYDSKNVMSKIKALSIFFILKALLQCVPDHALVTQYNKVSLLKYA